MGRVKIKFPDDIPLFTTIIPVRIGDINYGGHMGNDAFLSILHEARMRWLRQHGYDELNAGGVSLIMADVMMAYRAEVFYGDELQVALYADELTGSSFGLLYHITAEREGIRRDVVHARTSMLCFDYNARKISRMTEALKTLLTA